MILFSALCFGAYAEEGAYYDSPDLKPMPVQIQKAFEDSFKRLSLERAFIGPGGSKALGLNMLFSDKFFVSKIAVKYDVKGSFELDRIYRFERYKATHFKYGKATVALIYQGIDNSSIQVLKKILAKRLNSKTTSIFTPISSAHADECYRPEITPVVALDTAVSEGGMSSMISKCFGSMGDGVEDATVGTVKSIWSGIEAGARGLSAEAKRLWDAPIARLGTYVDYVGTGLDLLWDFSKTVSKMIVDPVYGAKLLKEKFGPIGEFFAEAIGNVDGMPLASKVDVICNIIGAIGVDALIVALTAGATSGKLAITVGKLLHKLKKVSALLGKGVKYSFKVMSGWSGVTLRGMKRIVEAGKEGMLHQRMKGSGCAF